MMLLHLQLDRQQLQTPAAIVITLGPALVRLRSEDEMANFAKLDRDGNVIEVVSVNNIEMLSADGSESEVMGIAFLIRWSGGYSNWKQTSYNSKIRKNYAGVGYKYDSARDAFIPPHPFASWTLNEQTCLWDCPVQYPTDGSIYKWDEASTTWDVSE
jgi:hypothetical protein